MMGGEVLEERGVLSYEEWDWGWSKGFGVRSMLQASVGMSKGMCSIFDGWEGGGKVTAGFRLSVLCLSLHR